MKMSAAHKDKAILVVDDVGSMCDFTKAILREVGLHKILTVSDGCRALAKLQKHHFDLVICDWNMPQMTGLELVKLMRGSDKWQNIPFLMVTASTEKENVEEAIAAGINGFIVKPFNTNVLYKKITEIFNSN